MSFDRAYVEEVTRRLQGLAPDATPRWGRMRGRDMVNHLLGAVEYSLGRHGEVPPLGNWFLRYVIGPLALNGLIKTPRNAVFRDSRGGVVTVPRAEGDALALREAALEFLDRAAAAATSPLPPAHPAFGDLGYPGWRKLHYHHFEHHLGQFGV